MRNRIGILIVLCASLFALSCNRSREKRVAFIPKGRSHVFWQSVHAGAIAAMRESPGDTIIGPGPPSDTAFEGQLQIGDAAINQHVDAICLAPIDKKVLVTVVERAAGQGIPVVIFDSPIDTDKFVAQVATDNYAGGQLGAARVGEILHGMGKIAEVAVQPGSASTMAREQGFEDRIAKDFPGIKIADKQYGMADFGQSLKVAENMLTAEPDMNGMFASNESSTVGAVRALKNKTGVKLVGFDSSPQLVEALKNGVVDSLVVQDPFHMGYKSMVASVMKLKGGTPERIQNITPTLVTHANMDTPEIREKISPDLERYLK